MKGRKRVTLALLGLAAALALLAGCATEQAATPTTAPAATKAAAGAATPQAPAGAATSAAPASTPAPKVKTGGILKVASDREQLNLDPHIDTGAIFTPLAYNTLLARDPSNKIVPEAADKWEIAPDGKSVTFTLHKGVKFWNQPPVNGREVVCDDWVYSLKRIASPNPEFQGKDLVDGITGYECPDKYTLKLMTDPPFAPLINNLGRHMQMALVPKELVDQQGDLREKFIGSGPFIIKEWVKGQVTRFVKNPDYFVSGVPYLDGVEVLLMPDKAARTAALRTKQVDMDYTARTPKDKESLEKTNPDILHASFAAGGLDTIRFNVTKPPFNNQKVRYAVNLAIDRKKLIQLGMFDGSRISGHIEQNWGELTLPMNELLALPGYRYPKDQDVAEAKRLMAEAGYANGIKATSFNWEYMWDYAAPVKDELAKIGIDVDEQNIPLTVWKPKMVNKDYEMAMGNSTLRADADGSTYGNFHPKGGYNESGINDPTLNSMLEQMRQTMDQAKRAVLAHNVELKIQELSPWVVIGQRIEYVAFYPYVKGIDAKVYDIPRQRVRAYVPYVWLDK